jgi:hypothetical protein
MCLIITESSRKDTANLIREHRQSKQPIIAYKILCQSIDFLLQAPFTMYPFRKGLNISNRRFKIMQESEKKNKEIKFGFHSFMNQTDAENFCQYKMNHSLLFSRSRVFKVKIEPKHVVSLGLWDTTMTWDSYSHTYVNSIVSTQLTLEDHTIHSCFYAPPNSIILKN